MEKKITFSQHTYTSSKSFGEYGTYQHTTDLSPDFIRKLEKLEYYAPPEGLSSNPNTLASTRGISIQEALEAYPVSFSYTVLEGKSIFCKTTYIGKDRHSRSGRVGNFFAHSLIQEGYELFSMRQLLGWTGWQSKIEGVEQFRQPLPTVEIPLDLLPTEPDLKALSPFLKANSSKLSELVDSIFAEKRILIIDTAANLLEWAKVLMILFPPHLGRSIHFSSYQYAPFLTNYQIVGISTENEYDLASAKEANFHLLKGSNHAKNAYTQYITAILTGDSENIASAYTDLMDFLQPKRMEQLNNAVKQEQILNEYRTNKHDFTLDTLKNHINKYYNLREPIEAILKANPENNNLYYDWATDYLESCSFAFEVFKSYYTSLPATKQQGFFQYFFVNVYKTNISNLNFYELINEKQYEQHLSSHNIEQLQQAFINDYYTKEEKNPSLRESVKDFDKNAFDALEKSSDAYINYTENQTQNKEICQALDKLEKLDFSLLKKYIDNYRVKMGDAAFFAQLKSVLEEKIKQKTRKELIEGWLNFNHYNNQKSKIEQQLENIRSVCENASILNIIKPLNLLNTIVSIKLDNTISISQIAQLKPNERENLLKYFKSEKENSRKEQLLHSYLEIDFQMIDNTATDPYKVVESFLLNYQDSKSLILEKYRAYYHKLDYHYFRYIQLSIKHNLNKFDKSITESYLDHLKSYRIKEVLGQDSSLIPEIDAAIKYLCNIHKLPKHEYIIPTTYEKDTQLFVSNDLHAAVNGAKILYLNKSRSYDYLLGILYDNGFFKKYWTYERWIMFIKELELDDLPTTSAKKNKYIMTTVDFFLEKIETYRRNERAWNAQNQAMRLLIDFTIAILIEFDIFTTRELIAAFRANKNHYKNLRMIFIIPALAHMKYILEEASEDEPRFKEFQSFINNSLMDKK